MFYRNSQRISFCSDMHMYKTMIIFLSPYLFEIYPYKIANPSVKLYEINFFLIIFVGIFFSIFTIIPKTRKI